MSSSTSRPDPAELLARVQREEARLEAAPGRPRGRLKVFFGMAPGVGKTYAMLATAQRLAREGVDVVVGVVETHGRSETEQMLLGLDLLPRRRAEYRGVDGTAAPVTIEEFDLEAALARRPELLVLDELAHTNAPGSRHAKRWQDVEECLRAGISVLTTLNVQHIESLNDVVEQITGVRVRETIPDAVFDQAEEIELVDLPPDALLERLRAGRVYVPETVRRAQDSFFRAGNLTALREMALRRTASWVDERMRDYKEGRGIRSIWPATERILVAVSPSPSSPMLVRAACRMAAGIRGEWIAAHVESPTGHSAADRDRVAQTLRLAESLGAETVTLGVAEGEQAATVLLAFARRRNVNRIVVGRTARSRLAEGLALLLGGPGGFVQQVIRESDEIDVHVIRGDAEGQSMRPEQPQATTERRGWARGYLFGTLLVLASAGCAWILFRPPDLSVEAMALLAGVLVTAIRFGRGPAMSAAVLALLLFNYLFTEPRFTLYVGDLTHLVTFAIMVVSGAVVGTLATRLRDQREAARDREQRAASLYSLTRQLATARTLSEVATAGARHVHDTFGADVAVAAGRSATSTTEGRVEAATAGLDVVGLAGSGDWMQADSREQGVGRWALDHGKAAGLGTQVLPSSRGRHIPLIASQGTVGVLCVRPRDPAMLLAAPHLPLLDTFAQQIALAMERVALIEGRQRARLEAESERLRSALLSSVSHDLRTPLASIAGSASTLRDAGESIDPRTRRELIDAVVSESARLNELIGNLVFATRLESGVDLRREWTTIEEIVGAGLAGHREALATRPFRVTLPPDLPMVRVDAAMMPQVIANLMDNALRHTPPGTRIALSARTSGANVIVQVSDEGPGVPEGELKGIFDRFHRGRGHDDDRQGLLGPPGMGLGLTICQGIVKAHGGRIWAEPNATRGTTFLFSLPIEHPQPGLPEELVPAPAGTLPEPAPAGQSASPSSPAPTLDPDTHSATHPKGPS